VGKSCRSTVSRQPPNKFFMAGSDKVRNQQATGLLAGFEKRIPRCFPRKFETQSLKSEVKSSNSRPGSLRDRAKRLKPRAQSPEFRALSPKFQAQSLRFEAKSSEFQALSPKLEALSLKHEALRSKWRAGLYQFETIHRPASFSLLRFRWFWFGFCALACFACEALPHLIDHLVESPALAARLRVAVDQQRRGVSLAANLQVGVLDQLL
jgi:hypothetical protein